MPTKRQQTLTTEIVTAVRSGTPRKDLIIPGKMSLFYINVILDAQKLRDRLYMERFFSRRHNLGRPIDMGGPRDVWIEGSPFDPTYVGPAEHNVVNAKE